MFFCGDGHDRMVYKQCIRLVLKMEIGQENPKDFQARFYERDSFGCLALLIFMGISMKFP